MPKLLADAHIPYLEDLFGQHFEVLFYQHPQELESQKLNYDVLICRSNAKIQQQILEKSSFKVIATASSGTEHVDLKALNHRGIHFFSGHGANANGVCDYVTSTLAYLLQKKILNQPKIAIVGYGAVGKKLYARLNALNFQLGVYDPFIPNRPQAIAQKHLQNFDCICLHPSYHQQGPYPSHHLLNAAMLTTFNPRTCVINAARGQIVDEKAILTEFKGIYCSDVFWHEPEVDPQIIARCTLATPHIAGHTIEAKRNISLVLAQNIHDFFGFDWQAPKIPGQITQTVNLANWQELALAHYDPSQESEALKADPEHFSQLRRSHHFRHDFPWMI